MQAPPNRVARAIPAQDRVGETFVGASSDSAECTLLGDQEVNGVEFTVGGAILPRWSVCGGLALMDGEVKKSAQPSEEGVALPYVPKAMLNIWSTYELPMRLTVGGGVNYSDGNFFNQTGTFNFVAGGTAAQPNHAANAAAIQALTKYWVFNAMASCPINRHLALPLRLLDSADWVDGRVTAGIQSARVKASS